jgi:hypothetical protein
MQNSYIEIHVYLLLLLFSKSNIFPIFFQDFHAKLHIFLLKIGLDPDCWKYPEIYFWCVPFMSCYILLIRYFYLYPNNF